MNCFEVPIYSLKTTKAPGALNLYARCYLIPCSQTRILPWMSSSGHAFLGCTYVTLGMYPMKHLPRESPELSTPASNKPRTSPIHESSHAILTTGTIRSGHWHLPWELSKAKTGWFQPLTIPNPPETRPDSRTLNRKKVWAIPSSRRERCFLPRPTLVAGFPAPKTLGS